MREALPERCEAGSLPHLSVEGVYGRDPCYRLCRRAGVNDRRKLVRDQQFMQPAPELADKIRSITRGKVYLIGVGGLFKDVTKLQPR